MMLTFLSRAAAFVLLLLPLWAQGIPHLPVVLEKQAGIRSETIALKDLRTDAQYSLLYAAESLGGLQGDARVELRLSQGAVILAAKTLHAGDADFYTQFRVPADGEASLEVRSTGASGGYRLQVNRWPLNNLVRRGPNARWQDAMEIPLGATVFGSADDSPYIPLPGARRAAIVEEASHTHWYRIRFEGPAKLVFFQLELMERDNIPVDISVHRAVDGGIEEFFEGEDPVTLPHEVQALPGNKFTPRLLEEPGVYYVAVRAAHPEYKLRTRVYEPPPYKDPQTAVRTALDYLLGSGDSWHANTPRRGGTMSRVDAVHQETSLCVACHVTHFTQRAQLYATRQGYPVVQRQQLQFMTERFYQNPRPLYGFEEDGAVWSRMISAGANVLGRMSHLLRIFEDFVSREPRTNYHTSIGRYMEPYYAGREKLPADETNGNTPLVSAHEVAWYAWANNKDPRLPEMIAKGEVKNMVDLCYQTLALADIDKGGYREKIAANANRILSLQQEDGQWPMRFKAGEPVAEFQTGHALWALHAAGIPATHPQVEKGLRYLMERQQHWGGWLDPLQSYENFRTPFRETQMAVLALSAYYPRGERKAGWDAPVFEELSKNPVQLLQQLDEVWERPSPAVMIDLDAATRSNEALIRQAATEAMGRLGIGPPAELLGDSSKMVQRTAAWAMRQSYTRRNPGMSGGSIAQALQSEEDRTRWGATRVFHTHFAALATDRSLATALLSRMQDPIAVIRMDAIRGLWQLWYWNADDAVREPIEDALLAAVGKESHPWVRQNLRHAIYNLGDENIRYLYNNWVPGLAHQEDRDRVIAGRLRLEERLARKFATVLAGASASRKQELLRALTEYPLRRADIYDLEADLSKHAPPVYNRIGNDVEQITFFGSSAEVFAKALLPLLEDNDLETRRLAGSAVMLVRETRFGDVNRLAGAKGDAVAAVMARVQQMPEAEEVARALYPPPVNKAVATATSSNAPQRKLDETFFRGYVQPILEKRGKDGYACVHCHASHAIFNATWGTVMKVVNTADPENSLLLLKPTSTAESEGVTGAATVAHGGGVRFAKDSPEYVTILEWIKGAIE